MRRRKFLQTLGLAVGLATVGAHRVLGEIVPILPPAPPIEERFLCEVEEGRMRGGVTWITRYTYAASEAEIRALGYTPADFPHTVMAWAVPDGVETSLRAFNETKEEK